MQGLLRLTALRAGVALAYHSLAEQGGDPAVELVPPHSRSLFEGQMEHLARRYRVVLAAELPSAVEARRRGERFPVAVTFDDDLASHVHFALPVLQRAGLHATYFLTGTSLDRPFAFWWERLQRACDAAEAQVRELVGRVSGRESREPLSIHATGRLVESLEPRERDRFAEALLEAAGPDPPDAGMRAADVRTLIAAGMEIGFHTRRHDPLTTLPDDLLAEALCTGRQELEALVGGPLRMIAYPHGKADPRVGQAAREASFALGYTTAPRSVRPTSDRFLLGRVNPSYRSVGHLALQIVFALARAHR
jgi:peptidoglycan/xylan/chitin deacetylase (PgdA/CDA1 family)